MRQKTLFFACLGKWLNNLLCKDFDVLVLDVIRVAMTSESKIGDGWVRAIDNAENFKSLDFLVLLLLYHLPNKKRVVESLIKNKIRAGQLTEDQVRRCFKNHSTVVRSEFESVQSIAEMLMVSNERALNQFSTVIFVQVIHTSTSSIILDIFLKKSIFVTLCTFGEG